MNKEPKAIYLKSVFKDFKSDKKVGKHKGKLELAVMGREFILKHTPEFLEYAVDYSMFDKFGFIKSE